MAEAVAVGIRIRPFNDREKNLNAELCVDVEGPMTILKAPAGAKSQEPRKFTFDASFWSHDGYEEDPNGYLKPVPGSRYADQQHVFNTFGQRVLDNAWQGYHCCLFAYGQTGSGKSYSMVGFGVNKGIVPLACEEIFRRIGESESDDLKFEVTVSMIEIYNEAVQDLLVNPKTRPKKGLEIHESKQMGVFVGNVSKRPVTSYQSVEKVVSEGTANRSLGATLMNATSSRAHTVLTIEFKQTHAVTGSKMSMINLVDLAGSEKAGQTGATGDRLKEGCAINKSLSALGNVIERLAEKATTKGKQGQLIPYRDSKLTRLLQNALGGSSKTIMICAISPASSNHEESLSTLRYADRAKKIKNNAVVNENPQDRLIRALQEENEKLKQMLADGRSPSPAAEDEEGGVEAKQKEIEELAKQLQDMERSFEEKLQEAHKAAEEAEQQKEQVDLDVPHISNINEDEQLTNKLQFAFKEGKTTIGKMQAGRQAPDVVLAGPGLQAEHAVVVNTSNVCCLQVMPNAADATFVNGKPVAAGAPGAMLQHGDRVAFGGSIFLFIDPRYGLARDLLESGQASFEEARKELAGQATVGPSEEEIAASKQKAEELERQVREAEEAKAKAQAEAEAQVQEKERAYKEEMDRLQKEWEAERAAKAEHEASMTKAVEESLAKAHADELARVQKEFEANRRKAEEEAKREMEELEVRVRQAAAEEAEHKRKQLEMEKLDQELIHIMPLVKEANLIAKELNRPHHLETRLEVDVSGSQANSSVRVTAAVLLQGTQVCEWMPETLENRVFLMRELLERFDEEGPKVIENLVPEDDPYWDPVETEQHIGHAQVLLEGLTEQLQNITDAKIINKEGRTCGTIHVEVWPVAADGSLGIPDEELVDDITGSKLTVCVKVDSAKDLPDELANDVRVEYTYFLDDEPTRVPTASGHNREPVFNHEHRFVQDPVTSKFVEYLQGQLVLHIYGKSSSATRIHEERVKAATPVPVAPSPAGEEASAPAPAAAEAAPVADVAPSAEPVAQQAETAKAEDAKPLGVEVPPEEPKAPDPQPCSPLASLPKEKTETIEAPPPFESAPITAAEVREEQKQQQPQDSSTPLPPGPEPLEAQAQAQAQAASPPEAAASPPAASPATGTSEAAPAAPAAEATSAPAPVVQQQQQQQEPQQAAEPAPASAPAAPPAEAPPAGDTANGTAPAEPKPDKAAERRCMDMSATKVIPEKQTQEALPQQQQQQQQQQTEPTKVEEQKQQQPPEPTKVEEERPRPEPAKEEPKSQQEPEKLVTQSPVPQPAGESAPPTTLAKRDGHKSRFCTLL